MPQLVSLLKPLVERSPFLAGLYRDLRDRLAYGRQPRPIPLGFLFAGHDAMERGTFEPVETRIVTRLLDDVGTLVNVGANIGYYCCLALSRGKHVIAFEPMPGNQRFLYRNVLANDYGRDFECYPIALTDAPGLLQIFGGGTGASLVPGWAGQTRSRTVPASTLDLVLGNRLRDTRTLVIVDIEGAEFAMLRGASRLLEAPLRPIWLVEISITEHQPAGVAVNPHLYATFELFSRHGYAALTADEAPRCIELAEIAEIARSAVDTLHTHNFLFVETRRVDEILARLRT